MNKRNLFTITLLCAAFLLHAQSGEVMLYGFKQRTTGGMQKRGDLDETGKLIKKEPAEVFQYAIYLASKSKSKIYPVQLWINGEAFLIKATWMPTAQLLKNHTRPHYENMTPFITTVAGVWKLIHRPLAVDKSDGRSKALAGGNDAVVLYKMGGKLRYGVLKKFTELDPVALQ